MKDFLVILVLLFLSSYVKAQTLTQMAEQSLREMKGRYEKLHDANVNIKYRSKGSAMAASYTWWSIFRRPSKRKYTVRINKKVKGNYMCFQFDHLSKTSQNGVMAHELSHIDFFHSLNFFGFIKFIIQQSLPKGLKKSERATDYRTIKNGMGKELRSWSKETRDGFLKNGMGPIPEKYSQRYLSPAEIDSVMFEFPDLYEID